MVHAETIAFAASSLEIPFMPEIMQSANACELKPFSGCAGVDDRQATKMKEKCIIFACMFDTLFFMISLIIVANFLIVGRFLVWT